MAFWKSYKYKNLTLFFFSLLFALYLSRIEAFHAFLISLNGWGYVSIFAAGVLFVSTFTVSTGLVTLLILAETHTPLEIGLVAGLGAVVGDLVIFQFVKERLVDELKDVYHKIDRGNHLKIILHSKHFRWTLPVLGAIIIASPLPDELGVSLMGISKMRTYKFLLLSFILNATGIFLIISAAKVF